MTGRCRSSVETRADRSADPARRAKRERRAAVRAGQVEAGGVDSLVAKVLAPKCKLPSAVADGVGDASVDDDVFLVDQRRMVYGVEEALAVVARVALESELPAAKIELIAQQPVGGPFGRLRHALVPQIHAGTEQVRPHVVGNRIEISHAGADGE